MKIHINTQKNKKAFTLIEIIVAITIFMIVMVSVMQIFWISSQLTNKIDINRQVQENIKNLTETIAEDIRKNWIGWVRKEFWVSYTNNSTDNWNLLKVWDNEYYLSDWYNWTVYSRVYFDEIETKCWTLKTNCFLVKNESKLTNSWLSFENLNFTVLWNDTKKLVINFTVRPATKKWISSNMIKKSKVIFQTTISERFIKTN